VSSGSVQKAPDACSMVQVAADTCVQAQIVGCKHKAWGTRFNQDNCSGCACMLLDPGLSQ
jgi:hypothetical protein